MITNGIDSSSNVNYSDNTPDLETFKQHLNHIKDEYEQKSQEILDNPNLSMDEKRGQLDRLLQDTGKQLEDETIPVLNSPPPVDQKKLEALAQCVQDIDSDYNRYLSSLSLQNGLTQAPKTRMFGL